MEATAPSPSNIEALLFHIIEDGALKVCSSFQSTEEHRLKYVNAGILCVIVANAAVLCTVSH